MYAWSAVSMVCASDWQSATSAADPCAKVTGDDVVVVGVGCDVDVGADVGFDDELHAGTVARMAMPAMIPVVANGRRRRAPQR